MSDSKSGSVVQSVMGGVARERSSLGAFGSTADSVGSAGGNGAGSGSGGAGTESSTGVLAAPRMERRRSIIGALAAPASSAQNTRPANSTSEAAAPAHPTPGQEMMQRVTEGLKALTPQQPVDLLVAAQTRSPLVALNAPGSPTAALRSPRYPSLAVPPYGSPEKPLPAPGATGPAGASGTARTDPDGLSVAAATAGIGLPDLSALALSPRGTMQRVPGAGLSVLRRASVALPVGPMLAEEAAQAHRLRERRASLPARPDMTFFMSGDHPF